MTLDGTPAEPLHLEPHPLHGANVSDFYELHLKIHGLLERTAVELGSVRAEQTRQALEITEGRAIANGHTAQLAQLLAVETVEERARDKADTARQIKEAEDRAERRILEDRKLKIWAGIFGAGGLAAVALGWLIRYLTGWAIP